MKEEWEKLLKEIDNYTALSLAIQVLEQHAIYKGFEDNDEPTIHMASSHELIMSWHGSELFPQEFIKLMESKGCIEPSDFRI